MDFYRKYVAECARIITENTAKISKGGYIKAKYGDVVDPKPQEHRSAEEIVDDVIMRGGLEVID